MIYLVFGSQGAGKSTYARKLSAGVNGVCFSIDDWMWQLFGPDLPQPMDLGWIMERVRRCETRIWQTAKQIAAAGGHAILDLGFMKEKDRQRFMYQDREEGLDAQLHYVDAPYEVRLARVMQRNKEKGDTFSFDVSPDMFNAMEKQFEKPTEAELREAVVAGMSE